MIAGVRQAAVTGGLIEPTSFDAGIAALRRTTEADGVFCYTFFKGVATNTPRPGPSEKNTETAARQR